MSDSSLARHHRSFRLKDRDIENLQAIAILREGNDTRALREALEFYRRVLEKRREPEATDG